MPFLRTSSSKSCGFRLRQPGCQTVWVRNRHRYSAFFVLGLIFCGGAYAQSAQTLQAARARETRAQPLAQAELAQCEASQCKNIAELSLLVGYLNLCDGHPAAALRQLSAHPAPGGLQANH